jgi:hypothetical protein
MDVSIVIVSWQVKESLRRCLTSIFNYPTTASLEVFVVDNNSTEGTGDMVKNNFPQVQLIQNEGNRGFSKACNQAIKKSVNPDSAVQAGSIDALYNFMVSTRDCGIAGCRIVNEDGTLQPSVRRFPDLLSHIFILLKLHNFFPNIASVKKYYLSGWPHNETRPVDQVMGACFMMKRQMLKKIGLFDEHFYIWYEEVDLCYRALAAGWKTYFFSDTTITHLKGQSFIQRNPISLQFIFGRSMLYYFFKHSSIFSYLILLLLYPVSIILAFFVTVLRIKKKNRKDL